MDLFDQELIAEMPALRAFALRQTRDKTRAKDLVQDTLERALVGKHTFRPGTSMKSWLFTIMHNARSAARAKEARHDDTIDIDEAPDGFEAFSVEPVQDAPLLLDDMNRMLDALLPERREAILHVCVAGMSVDSAAAYLGVPSGTIKSRISRARTDLAEMIEAGRLPKARGQAPDHMSIRIPLEVAAAAMEADAAVPNVPRLAYSAPVETVQERAPSLPVPAGFKPRLVEKVAVVAA